MAAYGWIVRKFIRYGEVITEHLAPGAVTGSKIAAKTIDAGKLVNVTTYNADATTPTLGSPVVVPFLFADGTATISVTMPFKVRVIGVSHLKTAALAGGNNTIEVFSGANSVTGLVTVNTADTVLTTSGFSINDANMDVVAAGLLKVTSSKVGSNSACIVYVTVIPVA
jgi:hypothetical protein